jgi:hypothetical protein
MSSRNLCNRILPVRFVKSTTYHVPEKCVVMGGKTGFFKTQKPTPNVGAGFCLLLERLLI